MKEKARERMEKEGGELVQAVEDHAVVPHDDSGHEAPHAQNIVSLVPDKIVSKETSLQDDTEVHKVAEVNHEQPGLGRTVLNISADIGFDFS
jgi:hypothetical protein